MPLSRFGFIVKGPGYSLHDHTAELASAEFNTWIAGVDSLDSAIDAAKLMVERGVQLIELCGGFSEEEAEEVRLQISDRVPVGVVRYTLEEQARIEKLLRP